MKILSTRLAMRDGYLPEQFRRTIVEWLKAGPPSKDASFNKEVAEKTQISARRHGGCGKNSYDAMRTLDR